MSNRLSNCTSVASAIWPVVSAIVEKMWLNTLKGARKNGGEKMEMVGEKKKVP